MSQFSSGVYIYDAVRTPKARVRREGGTLAGLPAHELLGQLLTALRERGLPADLVDDMVIGTSTAIGEQGGDIARASALWAGWPDHVPGGVVSRLCCSGLDALETAAAKVAAGAADVVVAGGVESMSRVPILSDRPGFVLDEMLGERTGFVTIGVSADLTAAWCGFDRTHLDAAAVESHRRALAAAGSAPPEAVIPVRAGGHTVLTSDEGARADVTLESLAALRPLFGGDPSWERVTRRLPGFTPPITGLHTIATAPQLADGAAAAVLGSGQAAACLCRQPVAEVVGTAQVSVRSPLLTGSVVAATRALDRAGIPPSALDVVEANESFACSALLVTRDLDLDPERVNPIGGSMATGHPLGASGGVLLVNALERLRRLDGEYALLTIPAALGLGAAVVVRRLR